jgi:hypothetical protein
MEEIIKYLQTVIKEGCKSKAINNFLISLYIDLDDEQPLFRHISSIETTATKCSSKKSSNALDLQLLLRTVLKTGRHNRSIVKLYVKFGMREQAVELALKVDPALARELASETEYNAAEKKKLWLMIVKSAVLEQQEQTLQKKGEGDGTKSNSNAAVSTVFDVLKECGDGLENGGSVLSIEDVLPFLPDFAQIDQFKGEICLALTKYSEKITSLKEEMKENDDTSEAQREVIKRIGRRRVNIGLDTRCALSGVRVAEAKVDAYAFPSGFVVLKDVMEKKIRGVNANTDDSLLSGEEVEELKFIEKRLKEINYELLIESSNKQQQKASGGGMMRKKVMERQGLEMRWDAIIASECPLTGEAAIESIDKLLIDGRGEQEGNGIERWL